MAFHVYILRCSDGTFYVGHTTSVDERIAAHNAGEGPAYTRHRRPVELAHSESFDTSSAAVHRERQLKKWTRRKKEALINGDLEGLHNAARRKR